MFYSTFSSVYVNPDTLMPAETRRGHRCPGSEAIGSWKLPKGITGNKTCVLWKCN